MMNIERVKYAHRTTTYDLGYIQRLAEIGRINTDLECQRGYVWDESRQQGLFDSLLRGHRIPEFHAIKEDNIYNIIDGKQRITTILMILNDEIPLKRSEAKGDIKEFLIKDRKNSIKFSELDKTTQNYILDTTVEIAEYTDVSDAEISVLFQKLNAGKALNKVGISLLENLLVRKYYTARLVDKHPFLEQIFTPSQKGDATDEATLIRLMHLLEIGDINEVKNLDAGELGKVIKGKEKEELELVCAVVEDILDEFAEVVESDNFSRISASFMPFLFFHFNSLEDKDKALYNDFITYFYARRTECGDNRNLTPQTVKNRIDFVERLFEDFKKIHKGVQ